MSLKNGSSKSIKKGRGSSKKSLKKKSMSISKSGIVRNSPVKEFNNLKLKYNLIEKKSLMKVFKGMEELKKKGYSNRIMETKEYCRYLRINIESEKMDKIMDILGIKDYSLMTMEEKCLAIKRKAPYIMSPRSTNLLMYLFIDSPIIGSLFFIFFISTFFGMATTLALLDLKAIGAIPGILGMLGVTIFYFTNVINYFGGTTFFLKLSRGAQSTMRHKIFNVIGEDTREY